MYTACHRRLANNRTCINKYGCISLLSPRLHKIPIQYCSNGLGNVGNLDNNTEIRLKFTDMLRQDNLCKNPDSLQHGVFLVFHTVALYEQKHLPVVWTHCGVFSVTTMEA